MTRDGSDGTYTRVFVYRVCIYAVRKRFYNFPVTAVTRLNAWIRRCSPLADALADCHQSPRAKFFSPKAVRHIVTTLASRKRIDYTQ